MSDALSFCQPMQKKDPKKAQKQPVVKQENGLFGAIRSLYMPKTVVKTVKRKGREAPRKNKSNLAIM